MQIKPGVRLTGLSSEMVLAATIADSVYRNFGKELVITSAVEGKHSRTSRHYTGHALDLRTRDFSPDDIPKVQKMLEEFLGDDFYLEFEGNHFHVQFSPKTITG